VVKSLDPKKIKSAQRALEVLEYFSDARPTATVMDIARSMGYPQSSTSELLNCLVSLGYLNRDRDQRTYRPTARVAVIGSSVQPELFRKGRLLAILDHLAEEAGVTVTLAHKVGMSVQHPVLARKLVHRINAEAPEGADRICAVEFGEGLRQIRIQGYAQHVDGDQASLSMLVSQLRDAHALALNIHGDAAFFEANRDWLLQMVRGAIARLNNPALGRSLEAEVAQPERRSA
jgi:DNA-binding IclR family transcriptional regulator